MLKIEISDWLYHEEYVNDKLKRRFVKKLKCEIHKDEICSPFVITKDIEKPSVDNLDGRDDLRMLELLMSEIDSNSELNKKQKEVMTKLGFPQSDKDRFIF